ncbi:MAG: GNAT family N-acetyltransferase, partial [Pseudomonadota bacterium]
RGRGLGTTLMREWSDRMVGIGRRRASLIVDEGNTRAREFYAKLGGQEGEPLLDSLAGHDPTPVRRVVWQDIAEIGWRARGEAIAKLAPPLSLTARELPAWSGAAHPVAAAKAAAARLKQPLGDPFGLTDYGVNRVEIAPGTRSTVQHYHSHEDEWVMVLEGALTLISEDRERVLHPGDCAGFPAGTGPAHLLENRGTAPAIFLEIGSRRPDRDITRYPDEDLMVAPGPDGAPWFQRRDGTPLVRAP